MTATRDKFGRPIVVVTGMGVVTSLGAGKTDNWAKLTAGESGIRTITRFPTDGLKTTMAGTIDFVPVEPFSSTDLSERLADIATEEAIAQSGNRQQRRFSRTAVSRGRAGRGRVAAAARTRTRFRRKGIRLRRAAAGQRRRKIHAISPALPVRFGGRSSRRDLRHQGLADFAVDGVRLRRQRHPARRRGHSPRRSRRRAVRRDRRIGQSGSAGPVLAALGAVDPQRSAASGGPAVLEEPRRLRDGRRRRCAGAGKL